MDMGHIINLVAQAFLLGEKAEMFEQALGKAERGEDLDSDAVKLWQLCGPIDKLHHAVISILRTPQRRLEFKRDREACEATELVPKRDNSTRYSPISGMIKRGIRLHEQIRLFYAYTYKIDFNPDVVMNKEDGYILTQLAATLVHFENATIASQDLRVLRKLGQTRECVPVVEALSRELTSLRTRFPLDSTFDSVQLDGPPDDLPALHDTHLSFPAENPAAGFTTGCTNRIEHTPSLRYTMG